MDDATFVTRIGMMDFVAYAVMAGAYWADSIRLAEIVRVFPDGKVREAARRFLRTAERLFRGCTASMVIVVLAVLLANLFPNGDIALVCKVFILLPTAVLLVFCIRYTMGRYFIPIDFVSKLETDS